MDKMPHHAGREMADQRATPRILTQKGFEQDMSNGMFLSALRGIKYERGREMAYQRATLRIHAQEGVGQYLSDGMLVSPL